MLASTDVFKQPSDGPFMASEFGTQVCSIGLQINSPLSTLRILRLLQPILTNSCHTGGMKSKQKIFGSSQYPIATGWSSVMMPRAFFLGTSL